MPFGPSPLEGDEITMCSLYEKGNSLSDVSKQTGFCVSTVTKVLKRNMIPRRRPGTVREKPTEKIEDSKLVNFKASWDLLDSTVKGTICENYVKTKLSEVGFDVWEPTCQNHRTDLIVVMGNYFKRIQVKAGTYDLKTKCFRVNFSRHRRNGSRHDYSLEDVDFFAVYCAGLLSSDIYIIPANEITRRNRCPRLFPHRERLLVCNDYSLEKFKGAFELLR